MRQNLFFIPHEFFGLPVFGFGWLALAWLAFSIGLVVWLVRRGRSSREGAGYLPVLALIGAAICFLLPHLEQTSPDGQSLGLPIRGFGVMLLAGVASGVALAVYRARRARLDPETIYALTFWMFLAAIVGARLFYVIEYWPDFARYPLRERVFQIVNFMEGGIVVYGSIAGGLAAFYVFCRKHRAPMFVVADVIAPPMVLGLAIGRIGCLLNGCCYGGVCQQDWRAITFPQFTSTHQQILSPAYRHQLELGQLHGIRVDQAAKTGYPVVGYVEPNSPAAASGLQAGTQIKAINGTPVGRLGALGGDSFARGPGVALETTGGQTFRWDVGSLPARSLPVHPTQLYSALNALLLCLVLVAYTPCARRDGEVFALMLTLYPVTRFLLEMIRNDEPAQFGTSLTISQLISIITLVLVLGLWGYLLRQPRRAGP